MNYDASLTVCGGCGQQVTYYKSDVCPACQIPRDVAESIHHKKTRMVSILGASGVGKTVYLGMLMDIIGQGNSPIKGNPKSVFSMNVQEQTIRALENRRFPPKTPVEADHWNWVHFDAFDAKSPRRVFEILTPDLAGEALAVEMETPNTFPAISIALQNSRAAVLLFDSVQVQSQGRESDLFGSKLVTYLVSTNTTKNKRNSKLKTPIAVVFTKADCAPEANQNPEEFAKMNMPGFVRACQTNFAHCEFFSTSIAGRTTDHVDDSGIPISVPLYVEPKGVVEPLQWIMQGI